MARDLQLSSATLGLLDLALYVPFPIVQVHRRHVSAHGCGAAEHV